MVRARYPLLFQSNTRVWLTALSRDLRRPATLDDMLDADLDRLAERGFDWVWFLSVWQTGPAGQQVSRSHHAWRQEFEATLPDLREEDIAGSGFAITGYTVHQALGGDAALARLRQRLQQRGLRLLLVGALQDRVALANKRFFGGLDTYLQVLDAERDLFEAELTLARLQRDERLNIVQLYRALGGGWEFVAAPQKVVYLSTDK